MVREIEVAPVGALRTSGGVAPQPEVEAAVELLMMTPAGRLSVTEKFVRLVSAGALTVILNLEFPPAGIVDGENDFEASRSLPRIVALVVAASKFPTPCAVVNAFAGIRFVNTPEGVPAGAVTGTEIVQVPRLVGLPAGMVPPERVTEAVVVVTVPPQVVVADPATINGVGKLSVTLTPVYAELVGF